MSWWLLPQEHTVAMDRGGGPLQAPLPAENHGVKFWPLDFFKNNRYQLAFGDGVSKYRNNHAMKWFREMVEYPPGKPYGTFGSYGMDLTFPQLDVCEIFMPQIIHEKGTAVELKTTSSWSFEYQSVPVPWSWQRMVAALNDDDLDRLVGGRGGGASRGIVGCKLMPRLGSYDHKRQCLAGDEGRQFASNIRCQLWDFVFFSTEGNVTGLRPKWDTNHFDVHFYMQGGVKVFKDNDERNAITQMIGPHGCSMGPGTYKHYKVQEADATWKARSFTQITHERNRP